MKTNEEFESEFIAQAKEKTGKSTEEWMTDLRPRSFEKQKELLDWLKKEQGINKI